MPDPQPHPCLEIVERFRTGELALAPAADAIVAALQAGAPPFSIEPIPSLQPLLEAVHARLAPGTPAPSTAPDPARHQRPSLGILDGAAERTWTRMGDMGVAGMPLCLTYHFAAGTRDAAERLARWMYARGGQVVSVRTPEEADSHDFAVAARTDVTVWTAGMLEDWMTWLRTAPLEGEASFRGYGLANPPTDA